MLGERLDWIVGIIDAGYRGNPYQAKLTDGARQWLGTLRSGLDGDFNGAMRCAVLELSGRVATQKKTIGELQAEVAKLKEWNNNHAMQLAVKHSSAYLSSRISTPASYQASQLYGPWGSGW